MPKRSTLRLFTAACAALVVLPAALHGQIPVAAAALGFIIPDDRTPAMVVVPDVRGETLSGAAARVAVAGLVPRHARSTPGDVDTSPVRRQWPNAGQRVPEGTVVALELATSAVAATRAASAEAAPAVRIAHESVSAIAEVPAAETMPGAWAWWSLAALTAVLMALSLPPDARPRRAIVAAVPSSGAATGPLPDPAAEAGHELLTSPHAFVRVRTRRSPPRTVVVAHDVVASPAD